MDRQTSSRATLSRRTLVAGWLALPFAAALVPPFGRLAAQGVALPLTPACGAPEKPTRPQTAGPFFTPGTPVKRNFRPDGEGNPVTLAGFVLDPQCRPVANALIELWHADSAGRYDNRGFDFRGHQFSDASGRYVFDTIVPGLYPGRTRHFHIKVQPEGGKLLTTQLYFPGESDNRRDQIFHETLVIGLDEAADGKIGRFDFVVAMR